MKKPDFLLWGSSLTIVLLYLAQTFYPPILFPPALAAMAASVAESVNAIWMSILMGMVMIALLARVPREFVMSLLGHRMGVVGVARAAVGGVLLDLCSHGILMVGAKLYERGASAGQMMAFLIASPWNSFSLTLILIALIGFQWTMVFIFLSFVIAVISGCVFEMFVARGVLPVNPHRVLLSEDFRFWPEAVKALRRADYGWQTITQTIMDGLRESRMVLRWIFLGIVLAAVVRAFVPLDVFQTWFGPTLIGLFLTLGAATIIEVCSEGTTPLAADLFHRASAPGNGFVFLMGGVATDYTEIMITREATSSWKIALFLPLITVPQITLLGWLLNFVRA